MPDSASKAKPASELFPESLEGASQLQRRLAGRVREEPLPGPPELIAGADVAYDRLSGICFAAVVTVDAGTGLVVEVGRFAGKTRIPYVPGFLSFREGPAVLRAWERLSRRPDLLICDGHGRAHPRRLGVACHLGLALDLPVVGVAKSRLVGEHRTPSQRRGSAVRLRHRGETIGLVVRTRDAVKPVYVSVGHRVQLDEAKRIVLGTARPFRLPEPQRQADLEVARMRRSWPAGQGGVE